MNISELLTLIRCPECSGEHLIAAGDKLRCPDCNAAFDIVAGVPVLLAQNNLNEQEKAQKILFEKHYSRFSDSDYKLERWRQSMLNRIFNNVRKEDIANYLDIGCGATGYTVIEAARRNGWNAVGMDISLEAMVKAKMLADKLGVGDKTAFIVGSAENVPLKSARFDYVSLISVLEHLENDHTVVCEVSRLLAEKGQTYICVPNAYSRIWPFLWPVFFYFDKKIGHLRHYSQESLDCLMAGQNVLQRKNLFYNGHLIKFFQILAEKFGGMRDEMWWRLEDKDINKAASGVQLNAIYQKYNTPRQKVILINPPLYFSDGMPKYLDVSSPPLGVLYLASYVNRHSDEVEAEILDVGAEDMELGKVVNRIGQLRPLAVGISAMTPQLQGALELAKAIKSKFPGLKIFIGGAHVSADPDFVVRHKDSFDYAIMGEAEVTFLNSLVKLKHGEIIPMVQKGEPIEHLDEVPIPARSLINPKSYSFMASVMFSRGCPFQCYYCSRPAISRRVRYRSAENMLLEIRAYLKEGISHIAFQDDTLTINRERVMELCRLIISEGVRIRWGCNARIDLVDDELLAMMKQAGCDGINFGIESGVERVRKEVIRKGDFTNEDIRKVFALCRKHRLKIVCYFMIGHPTETREELLETKTMILTSGIDTLGLSLPYPFPGSQLWEIAKHEGIIDERIIDEFAEKKLGEGYAGVYPVYIPKSLDAEFVYGEMQEINRRFYLNFKTFLGHLREDILSPKNLVSDAKDMISLVARGISSRKPSVKPKTP